MSRSVYALLFALLALNVGCRGPGMHRKGERQFELSTFYGTPAKRRALFWVVDGESENAGVRVAAQKFVLDRVAVAAAVTPFRIFKLAGPDAIAGEVQFGARYHIHEFEIGKLPVSLFVDGWLGFLVASQDVPDGGTQFNFTQDTGGGFEIALDGQANLVFGYKVKHLSNGRGSQPDNPSQNDHQFYLGLLLDW